MFESRWFRLLLVVAVSGVAIWFLTRDTPVKLDAPPTPPRPEPVAEPGASALAFASADDTHLSTGNALRRHHNQLVEDLARAIARYEAGDGSIRVAEQIEMRVFVARHQLGVADEATFHGRMALLLGREVERLEQLAKQGKAGQDELADARLFVARERYLAGESDSRYAEMRADRIAYYEDRVKYLAKQKQHSYEGLKEQLDDLLEEFPAPEPTT